MLCPALSCESQCFLVGADEGGVKARLPGCLFLLLGGFEAFEFGGLVVFVEKVGRSSVEALDLARLCAGVRRDVHSMAACLGLRKRLSVMPSFSWLGHDSALAAA